MTGGLLMAALWFRFTTLHGPTSFNEDRRWLGHDPLFWGSMMSAPPSLLISLGLFGHRSMLLASSSRRARIGFFLVMVGFGCALAPHLCAGHCDSVGYLGFARWISHLWPARHCRVRLGWVVFGAALLRQQGSHFARPGVTRMIGSRA
jgi:hypothetical protein